MLARADLHIHTTCSDGRLEPEEAVEIAIQRKLAAISITDHDTFNGYKQAREKAENSEVELIPGIEITSSFHEKEAHLLAYYFDVESGKLEQLLLSQRVARRERIKGIIETLEGNGLDINYDEVRAEANGANIGRPHVANVLVEKGYVGNYFEAFTRFLSTERLGEIANTYPDFKEVIKTVKNAGGACILAHPGRLYSQVEVEEFIQAGIDGIECIHPSHNYTLQKLYTEIVEKKSLLMTGGSDYHGGFERAPMHVGVVSVAAKYVEKMRRMTDQRKKIISIK